MDNLIQINDFTWVPKEKIYKIMIIPIAHKDDERKNYVRLEIFEKGGGFLHIEIFENSPEIETPVPMDVLKFKAMTYISNLDKQFNG